MNPNLISRLTVDHQSCTQIDYGESYEAIRVKNGYSRLSQAALKKEKASLISSDADAAAKFSEYSAATVHDVLHFLEKLFIPKVRWNKDKLQRALILSVLILCRVKSIQKEFQDFDTENELFCNNGYTTMDEKKTEFRAKTFVREMIALLSEAKGCSKSDILSEIVTIEFIKEAIVAFIDPNGKEADLSIAKKELERLVKIDGGKKAQWSQDT